MATEVSGKRQTRSSISIEKNKDEKTDKSSELLPQRQCKGKENAKKVKLNELNVKRDRTYNIYKVVGEYYFGHPTKNPKNWKYIKKELCKLITKTIEEEVKSDKVEIKPESIKPEKKWFSWFG